MNILVKVSGIIAAFLYFYMAYNLDIGNSHTVDNDMVSHKKDNCHLL